MTSTIEGAADQILKQDRLGRVWTPAAKRAELLAEFERSGMSGQQFAAYVGAQLRSERIDACEFKDQELSQVLSKTKFIEKGRLSAIIRAEDGAKFPLITFKFAGGNAEQFLDELVAGTPIKAEFTQYALVFTPS